MNEKNNDFFAKNEKQEIKNEYALISLTAFALCVLGFIFPISYTSLTIIGIFLVISLIFSFAGVVVSVKIEQILGFAKGFKTSFIVFCLSTIIYYLPFILDFVYGK